MEGYHNIRVEVISQKGKCWQGHKLGDSWIVKHKTPEGKGICLTAFAAMCTKLYGLEYGGIVPWKKEKDELTCACPDAENPVVFKLTRLKE
jgi:uncharacterized repeat protein (TIGR04076 family)